MESGCLFTKLVFIKQSEELESTNVEKVGMVYEAKVTEGIRDLGSERADALRWISLGAQVGVMQSPSCVESQKSLPIFLTLKNPPVWFPEMWLQSDPWKP